MTLRDQARGMTPAAVMNMMMKTTVGSLPQLSQDGAEVGGHNIQAAEVLGFTREEIMAAPLGGQLALAPRHPIEATGRPHRVLQKWILMTLGLKPTTTTTALCPLRTQVMIDIQVSFLRILCTVHMYSHVCKGVSC